MLPVKYISNTGDSIELRSKPYALGPEAWAICRDGYVLNKTGQLEYEPMPSSRTDEFLERTRFATYEQALAMWTSWRYEEATDAGEDAP